MNVVQSLRGYVGCTAVYSIMRGSKEVTTMAQSLSLSKMPHIRVHVHLCVVHVHYTFQKCVSDVRYLPSSSSSSSLMDEMTVP